MAKVKAVTSSGFVTESGQVLSSDDYLFVAVPKNRVKLSGWFMGFAAAFIELAKDKRMDLKTKEVLMYLLGIMGFENTVAIEQSRVAEELGMQKQNVYRAFKQMLEAGVLVQGPKLGKSKSYTINLNYAWKGKAANRQKEIAKQWRESDPNPAAKPKEKQKTGSKKKITKPLKTKAKLKLVQQLDGEL